MKTYRLAKLCWVVMFACIEVLLSGCNRRGNTVEQMSIRHVALAMQLYADTNNHAPPTNWAQLATVINIESITPTVQKYHDNDSFTNYYTFLQEPLFDEDFPSRRILLIRVTPHYGADTIGRPYVCIEGNQISSGWRNEYEMQNLFKLKGVHITDPYASERIWNQVITALPYAAAALALAALLWFKFGKSK